jgi:hypothetical protein
MEMTPEMIAFYHIFKKLLQLYSDGSGKAPDKVAEWLFNPYNFTVGVGRGILGFKGDDYYDRASILKYGMRVSNEAVPIALQADGMFGTPSMFSPKYAVSFNGVAAQTTAVDAGSSLFSGTAGSIAGSSQLNAAQQNSNGSGNPEKIVPNPYGKKGGPAH